MRDLVPLTSLGLAVLLAAAAAIRFLAFEELDLVALVLGWGAVGLVVVANALVVVAAVGLSFVVRSRTASALRGETRSPLPTGFSFPTLRFVPLVTVDAVVDEPARVRRELLARDGRWHERLSFEERGVVELLSRRISVGDVFGLARITFTRVETRSLTVVPHLGRLGQMPTLRSMASGDAFAHPSGFPDGDRIDLRRYAPGDPARFIHWKVFGRTRKLVVRMQERAIAPSHRVVAYLVAGPDDEASAAAAMAAVRYGALGDDWSFGADGSPRPTGDVDEAVGYVVRSIASRPEGARDLDAYLRTVEARGPTSLVLFVPPRPGPWLDRVLSVARPGAAPLQVVIAVDALDDAPPPSLVRRVVRFDPRVDSVRRSEFDEVRTRLLGAGADVTVVERPTGRVLATHGRTATALRGAAA